MTEVLFYHLERSTLEQVLPSLLEKCLERQWNVVVQTGTVQKSEELNRMLWSYRDDSFLPHGTKKNGNESLQPIFISDDDANPNKASVRFLLDGAGLGDISGYIRVIFIFTGHDVAAVAQARENWKTVKAAGHEATYWQQNAASRWEQKG